MKARLSDERGLLGFSLIRWLVVLVVLGLVLVEGGSIVFTTVGLQNAADAAAVEAADTWNRNRDLGSAAAAAETALDEREQDDAKIVEIDADNSEPYEVRLTVVKRAPTLLVHRIEFLAGFARVEVHAKAASAETGV